jgi:hypothetical protein
MKRWGRAQKGGLFPEDGRRRHPVPLEPAKDTTAESELRSRILQLLLRSSFQAAVTDACLVHTTKGKRRYVYPDGWPDVTASIPVTGRGWAIEVKASDGEFRESQERKLYELEAAGWLVTRAVGEQGVVEVGAEIKRQLQLLPRRAFEQYLLRLRAIEIEARRREADALEEELRARARG